MELSELPDIVTAGDPQHPDMHQAIHLGLKNHEERIDTLETTGGPPGPTGPAGAPGTIIGILGPSETPPPGSPVNSLWFVADTAVTPPPVTYLTPSHVGNAALGNTGSITTTTVTMPAGAAAGDLAIASVAYSPSAGAVTPSAGWTAAGTLTSAVTSLTIAFFTKVLVGGEPNFQAVTPTGQRAAVGLQVIRNVTGIATISSDESAATSSTKAAPTITHTAEFCVVAGWAERSSTPSTGLTRPSGLTGGTEAFSVGTGSASIGLGFQMTSRDAGTSFSPGNWVSAPSFNAGTVTWTMALAVKEA